jgi:chitinase
VKIAIYFFLLCGLTAFSQETNKVDKVFVGYVFRSPSNINFKLYTHLAHAFITADENGIVRTNRNVPSRELISQAHQAGVKVVLSLGGWGWDKQFAAIVSKPEAEDRYATSVLEMVDAFDYDGIDLDWEYPDTKEEVAGFERLARRFRKQLDQLGSKKHRPMVQTMAAAASTNTLKWLPTELLLDTMNWINVMTYDMAGEWTDYAGHHSPLFASAKQPGSPRSSELSIKYLMERGMPASRLALGIPLYGKGFSASEPYAKNPKKGQRGLGGHYAKLVQLQKEQGWTRQWDDETKNPWLVAPDRSAVIGYDDPESVALKTEWAMKLGLRGVFFWEVSGDRLADGTNPLQEASRQRLNESVSERLK